MRSDFLFWFHLAFVLFFVSIPFWPIQHLKYGIYLPFLLALGWQIFDGCPLTKIDVALNDEYFSQILLKPFMPDISKEATARFTYFILLSVTLASAIRLCPSIRLL